MGSALSKLLKLSSNNRAAGGASKRESQEVHCETCNVTSNEHANENIDVTEYVVLQNHEEGNATSDLQRDRVEVIPTSNVTNREVNSTDLQKVVVQRASTSTNILERNLLNSLLKYCDDWQNISEKLGFDKRCFYKKSRFVECFTWLFWKAVLQVYKGGNHDIITNIERLPPYVNIEYSFWDLDFPQFSRKDKIEDFPCEIWEYIPRLKGFLRSFNIDADAIQQIFQYDNSSSEDISYRVMELIGLNKIQSWSIWKYILLVKLKFDGPQIVEDIENDFPYLKNIKKLLSADEMIVLKNFLNDEELKRAENIVGKFSEETGYSTMKASNNKNPTMPSLCDVKVAAAVSLCKEAEEEYCDDILEAIAKRIDDVSSLSSIFGFEENSSGNALHVIKNVTWLLWKFILYEDLSLVNEIEKAFPYLKGNTKQFTELSIFEQTSHGGICELIKENLSEWKEFGRVMGVPVSKLEHLEDKYPNRTKDCVDALMRQHCYPFDPVESFNFWVKYLLKFENGREVAKMICDKYPTLIHARYLKHAGEFNENFVIMHHHELSSKDIFKIDKYKELLVPITKEVKDYQSKEEFSETTAKYHHRYEMICDVRKLDFSHEKSPCVILKSIDKYLEDSRDDGFVYKGYSLTNHYHLFADGIIPVEKSNNNIIAYIANDGVLLHIKFCDGNKDDEKINSLMRISKEFVNDVRLAQSIHPCIQNNPIIHVGVVVCSKSLIGNETFLCSDCRKKNLLIERQKISNVESFSDWYQKTVKQNNAFKDFKNQQSQLSEGISKDLKENIIIYMALDHYRILPFFTKVSHCQMNELKKLVNLTGCQMKIYNSPFKHKIIKGGYGSGKSIVLEKLFEATICNSTEDIFFYICYDPMSKFHLYLQSILKNEKKKNVLICSIQELPKSSKLNLSSILRQIKNSWKSSCCHFFIDEFNGLQLTKEEVDELSKILQEYFIDSHINIAVQSFEYKESGENSNLSGFQYDYLKVKTDFELFELDYSLRCSKEINNFVNETIQVLESSKLKRPRKTHPFVASDNTVIDQEMVDDKTSTIFHVPRELYEHDVMFNQPKELGHNVTCKKVQMIEVNESLEWPLQATYIEETKLFCAINYFLRTIKSIKIVICAFNEMIYNSVEKILSHLKVNFTNEVTDHLKGEFQVYLIDHASPRGFEFEHFMFVFGMERKYMNYRLIECFTRATTNLYLVVNVEEQGIKHNKVAQDLIKLWRKHSDVKQIVPNLQIYSGKNRYESTNSPTDLCRDNTSLRGEELGIEQNQHSQHIEADKKSMRGYRWSNAYPANEIVDVSKDDEENHMMKLIFKKDNHIFFQKFVSSNNKDLAGYCKPSESKSYLHIAAYYGALNICKLLVEKEHLKINQSFDNGPTPLEDAIKHNRFEVTKYFLQHTKKQDLTDTYFEKLIKHAKNEEIVNLLQKTYQQKDDF